MCAGFRFNEASLTCEFYEGCLAEVNTSRNLVKQDRVYVQLFCENVALGKYASSK